MPKSTIKLFCMIILKIEIHQKLLKAMTEIIVQLTSYFLINVMKKKKMKIQPKVCIMYCN